MAGARHEDPAPADFGGPHDGPGFAVEVFDLGRTGQWLVCDGRAGGRSYQRSDLGRSYAR